MKENRYGSHTVTRLTAHLIWATKYRYHVLTGDIKVRCRDLLIQICDAEDVRILKGVVGKDHVHMHIEYPPSKSLSDLVKRFKGRTSRMLQQEYPELRKRYWGRHFWAIGYGAWSTGNVTNERDGSVTVIDTASDKIVSTFKVGGRLRGVRVGRDGELLYVASSTPSGKNYDVKDNHAAVLDASGGEVVATYEVGTDPEQIDVSPDGAFIYASNEDAGTASVVSTETGKTVATLVVGTEPEGCRISPDGRWVYITSETSNVVTVIDTGSNKVAASFLVDSRPREVAFSRDGTRAYVTTEIGRTLAVVDAATHKVIRTVLLPNSANGVKPMGVVVSRDGTRVYVSTGRGGTVLVVDAKTFEIVAEIRVGQRPWGLAITPDGKKVYAACGGADANLPGANEVTVIDTETNAVVARIGAGDGPWGVAVGP